MNFVVNVSKKSLSACLVLLFMIIISGCSFSDKKDKQKAEYYGSSSRSGGLEVPPDLTQTDPDKNVQIPGSVDSNSGQQGGVLSNVNVLNEPSNIKMLRDGQQRWLLIDQEPAQVWPGLVEFWEKDGIKLTTVNAQSGVIETDWLINYADLTSGVEKLFRGLVNKLTSSGQRDKYRVRIDYGQQNDTSEVYVTHQGMEEVAVSPSTKQVPNYKWVKRPADPGLEIEVMRQIMVYLGVDKQQADQIAEEFLPERKDRARLLIENVDEPVLVLDDSFSRAWQRVGLALDRSGYIIQGRNREQGGYVIELANSDALKEDKPGFFSRLFRKKKKQADEIVYRAQVRLIPQKDEKTVVAIASEEGEHDSSQTAISLLEQLYEQLK